MSTGCSAGIEQTAKLVRPALHLYGYGDHDPEQPLHKNQAVFLRVEDYFLPTTKNYAIWCQPEDVEPGVRSLRQLPNTAAEPQAIEARDHRAMAAASVRVPAAC